MSSHFFLIIWLLLLLRLYTESSFWSPLYYRLLSKSWIVSWVLSNHSPAAKIAWLYNSARRVPVQVEGRSHRADAALLAISLRLPGERRAARALPPALPTGCPGGLSDHRFRFFDLASGDLHDVDGATYHVCGSLLSLGSCRHGMSLQVTVQVLVGYEYIAE